MHVCAFMCAYACAHLQVCSVLESLDREYRRDEDWCNTDKAAAIEDKVAYVQQLINKHQEQKEAFLKVYNLIIVCGTMLFLLYLPVILI